MACPEASILADLITNRDWQQARTICDADAELASQWYSLPNFYDGISDDGEFVDVLPIHQACANQPTRDVIHALTKLYPKCIKTTEPLYMRLPLHIACRSGASEDTIGAIIDLYPEGCRTKDVLGRLPLHYACANGASNKLIKKLVDSYPQGCQEKDMRGWIPLHILVSKGEKSFKVDRVVEAYPEGMNAKTAGGKTPRDLAKGMRMKFKIRRNSRTLQ